MNRPIFNDNPIFGNKLKRTSCPGKSDICGNVQGVLPTHIIPKCNDLNFQFSLDPEEAPSGCCVVETPDNTCKTYVPESADLNGNSYDIGINFFDENGKNPRKICHSAPIRKRVMKIPQFLYSSLLSIVLVIVAVCIGACYEFWFKYGVINNGNSGCGTFKYVDDCNNELGAIDYAFPSKLNDYPYKPCNSTKELDFPYNLFNYSDQVYNAELDFGTRFSKIFSAIGKAFSLNLLYTVFFSRLFISTILKSCSTRYQKLGDRAWGYKNIVFLLLTGILFGLLAKYVKIKELNYGPGLLIYLLLMFVVFAMFATMFLTNFFLYWGPKYYNEMFKESKISNGYTLYANVLYHIRPFGFKSIVNILLNIILILFILISYSFCFSTGFLGSIMGLVWMIASLIYNIFVIPILNIGCFLSVISDHSWLITIMLCISIVLSSRGNLPPTITGILGGFVALLILLLTYQNISK
jgi:hypothetical protein